MKLLAIETSCDETAITVLEVTGDAENPHFCVLASEIASQAQLHAEYGGVFPGLAKREHIKNLPIVLEKVLRPLTSNSSPIGRGGPEISEIQNSKISSSPSGEDRDEVRGEGADFHLKNPDIDAIAVTVGPGLEPALWTGIVFAKELAEKWQIPIIPVNHMEGHILSALVPEQITTEVKPLYSQRFNLCNVQFPAIVLLVSGGHTELVLVKKIGAYEIIGETRDDAAGECFDKVARMLELPYPGGPEISRLAEQARNKSEALISKSEGNVNDQNINFEIKLPRPMLHSKDFDFSFSGLKTAVLYLLRDLKKEHPDILENVRMLSTIAQETEDAIIEVLVSKTFRALEEYGAQTLLVGGGVSANAYLRETLIKACDEKGIALHISPLSLTGDNAIMIALAGYFQFLKNKKGVPADSLVANGTLRL